MKVGNGLENGTNMGPLAHDRRLDAMEAVVSDAVEKGAKVETGGERMGRQGYFFAPTVLTQRAEKSPRHERRAVRPGFSDGSV